LSTDQVTSDTSDPINETPPETEAETLAEEAAAIDSSLAEEGAAIEAAAAEETPVVEPAATEATGSSFLTSESPTESNINTMNQVLHNSAASETAPADWPAPPTPAATPADGAAVAATGTAAASNAFPRRGNANNIEANTTLYVGNLYFEVSEDALQRQFSPYGKINRTRIIYDHRGLSKG
jgi:hypothetical protein